MNSWIKSPADISAMREGGRMLATVLDVLCKGSSPGVTPRDMSALASKEIKALGGKPAFLGFEGYPDVICVSVNEQVQHGIPSERPFQNGDIVNYDFGVIYKGLFTDAGTSISIGHAPLKPDAARLLEGTRRALDEGITALKVGNRVGDISATIERCLKKYNLGIVKELVGHGVGYELHEDPEVPNYGQAGLGPLLKAGMTLAIEPIATLGSPAIVDGGDGWTLVTADGSWSCQFEHTVLVSQDGAEVLTKL